MTSIPSQLSVGEAATIINAIITFIQITLSLALIIVLIHFLPKTNSAASWSSISRTLHSSIWPVILRTESSSDEASGTAVSIVSYLSLMSTILIPIAGIALPLGLREGPLLHSSHQYMEAKYILDPSALGLATSPDRQRFQYGRLCGVDELRACPGGSSQNKTGYPPSTVKTFRSTPRGPFSMEYRRFSDGSGARNQLSAGIFGTFQSLIPREDIFVVEGLIVDMSLDHPGVGFWNQTVPAAVEGGTWTQDVLWLEPDTECVDTNLTMNYMVDFPIQWYNITDHGGFSNLSENRFIVTSTGQDINLRQHAYIGAVNSNFFTLRTLKLASDAANSYMASDYFVTHFTDGPANNRIANLPLNYSISSVLPITDLDALCQGYDITEISGMQKVQVICGVLLGPPQRTDGEDPRIFDRGSRWSQTLHVCASATRASIRTVAFSMNDTSNFQSLHVTRLSANRSVLWGVEKTAERIQDMNLLWGRVADEFENDPSLSTLRSDHLYLPAGASGTRGSVDDLNSDSSPAIDTLFPGEPLSAHATAWVNVYGFKPNPALTDYTGFDYSIRDKFQMIFEQNPLLGPAQIRNIVWTDIMANSLVGTQASPTLLVARNRRSINYGFRFAIPGFILAVIWAPIFMIAVTLLVTRMLTFSYMRQVLDHTSVGKVVVGGSALQVVVNLDAAAKLNRIVARNLAGYLGDVSEAGEKSPGLRGENNPALVLLDLSRKKGHPERNE